jgi:two-component system response regulator (stage 0 sporulation protein F)
MDGLTLLEHIKHINPETKTIIMSAFDDKDLLYKSIELGVFRYLNKPVNINELADVLHKAVTGIQMLLML